MQKVTWTTGRVVRVCNLAAWWAGIEVWLLRISAGVRAKTCRQRVDESAPTTTLATSAATGAADAAAGRTTVGAIATTTITHPVAIAIAAKKTAVAQCTAIAIASVAAAFIHATAITTAWITALFAAASWIANTTFWFAAYVATTTWVTAALAGHAAVSTTACRQAEHGNDNHELFHQKSP